MSIDKHMNKTHTNVQTFTCNIANDAHSYISPAQLFFYDVLTRSRLSSSGNELETTLAMLKLVAH